MAYIDDLHRILGIPRDYFTSDVLNGTSAADIIYIHGGHDQVIAGDGDDAIFDISAYPGGNSGIDLIRAGNGNDLIVSSLDGGGNLYDGGTGIDRIDFSANVHGVSVDLAAGTASDRATQAVSTLLSIENASGSAWTDYIYGNAASNELHGFAGDDLIRGLDGADRLYGDAGQDVLFGGNQGDQVNGGDGNDMLYGEAGNDSLSGDDGNDYLIGGAGIDLLTGGLGADTFRFAALSESGITKTTVDTIADFQHLLDRIDVADIDAKTAVAGNQAFTFIGSAAFSAAGQIRAYFDTQSQDTIVMFNTDNDRTAEMVLRIDPQTALSAADFVL